MGDASDAYTVDWEANIALGTTFGIGGSSVGFCTPDTNHFQTLTPIVSYAGQFGPKVLEADAGGTAVGFSFLGHPLPQVAAAVSTTYHTSTGEWYQQLEFRIYLSKASLSNPDATGSAAAG